MSLLPSSSSSRQFAPSRALVLPPIRWGMVECGLTRSGTVTQLNFPFLDQQRIRTILVIRHRDGEDREGEAEILSYAQSRDIKLVALGSSNDEDDDIESLSGVDHHSTINMNVSTSRASYRRQPLSESFVLRALNILLDPSFYPLHLLSSLRATHLLCVVIGCFRKLQRWTLSSIFAEYRRYATAAATLAGNACRHHDHHGVTSNNGLEESSQQQFDEQFIELFDVELLAETMALSSRANHLRTLNVSTNTYAIKQAKMKQQAAAEAEAEAAATSASMTTGKQSAPTPTRSIELNQAAAGPSSTSPPEALATTTMTSAQSSLHAVSSAAPVSPSPSSLPHLDHKLNLNSSNHVKQLNIPSHPSTARTSSASPAAASTATATSSATMSAAHHSCT